MDKQLVLILFKLINFAVLIGIGWYLWRRYVQPYLVHEFDEQQAFIEGLHRTHTRLQQEKKLLVKTYEDEQQERELLKERLSSWRDALEREQVERDQLRRERQELLNKRVAEQLKAIEQHHLYQQLYEDAIEDARIKLEKQFDEPNVQKKFMETMLKRLQ